MRLVLACLLSLTAMPALACGPETDCIVGDRTYRLYVPDDTEGPIGVIAFAHGYRGSGAGAMRNPAFERLADEMGMAFVALDAGADDWNLANRPREPQQAEAREYDYVAAVMADLSDRIEVDPGRTVLTGFSAGGMFTWTIACGMSDAFAGYVPMSGTFWAPVPETCPTPVAPLVHIHGTEDPVVPIMGRPIGQTSQGQVPRALALYAAHGAFRDTVTQTQPMDDMQCAARRNAEGTLLDFCTFPGGHSFSVDRLRHGIARVLGDA